MAARLRESAARRERRRTAVQVAGPAPAYVARRADRWRFNVVLRGADPVALLDAAARRRRGRSTSTPRACCNAPARMGGSSGTCTIRPRCRQWSRDTDAAAVARRPHDRPQPMDSTPPRTSRRRAIPDEEPLAGSAPADEPIAGEPAPDGRARADAGRGARAREWMTQLEAMIQDDRHPGGAGRAPGRREGRGARGGRGAEGRPVRPEGRRGHDRVRPAVRRAGPGRRGRAARRGRDRRRTSTADGRRRGRLARTGRRGRGGRPAGAGTRRRGDAAR